MYIPTYEVEGPLQDRISRCTLTRDEEAETVQEAVSSEDVHK